MGGGGGQNYLQHQPLTTVFPKSVAIQASLASQNVCKCMDFSCLEAVYTLGGPGLLLLGRFFAPASEIKKSENQKIKKWSLRNYFRDAAQLPRSNKRCFLNGVFQSGVFRGWSGSERVEATKIPEKTGVFRHSSSLWRGLSLSQAKVRSLKNTVWKTPFGTLRNSGTNHRNRKSETLSLKDMRSSEFPWCGNFRDKSQKCFGPGISDFPRLSVKALFWWAKGRRPLGPPNVYTMHSYDIHLLFAYQPFPF